MTGRHGLSWSSLISHGPGIIIIEQLRSGSAPRNIKEFAAQGMLPLAVEELVPFQVQLSLRFR